MIERTLGRILGTQVIELHLGEERTYQLSLDLRRMSVAYKDYVGVLTPEEALRRVELPGMGSFTRMELVDHATQWGDPIGVAWAQGELEREYAGYKQIDHLRARLNPQSMVQDVEDRFRMDMLEKLITEGRIPRVDFGGIITFCYIPPRDAQGGKPYRIALTKVQAADIRERVEVATYSEKCQGMDEEQLNEQLQQVLGFISGNPSVEIPKFNVVNPKEGDKRMLSETHAILKGRYSVLLGLAPIKSHFRGELDRLLFVHYVMLPGGAGIDDSTRTGINIIAKRNIFYPEEAKEIERVWYHNTWVDVKQIIAFLGRGGYGKEEVRNDTKWRLDSMEEWRQEFVACHGEEP